MTFDFDEPTDRRGTMSYKWDSADSDDIIPLWVADMDFRTAPAIVDALKERVGQGIFGYTKVPGQYYRSVVDWFNRRHGFDINPDWIIYTSGVVPAVSAIIKACCAPGDKVIVQTPVYNCFFSSIRNNGCEILENVLTPSGDTYTIDFDDLERKASDPKARLMLLCNPHNPVGRVWTPEELRRIGQICLRHNILVVSDEIHCELVYRPHAYTPFASLSDEFLHNSVTCISPSKAFNIAGLQIANIVACDSRLRARIDKAININEVCDVNPFGVIATIEAYDKGEEWLLQLLSYLQDNYIALRRFFAEKLPSLKVTRLEGTYLVWVDCRCTGLSSAQLEELLYDNARVWINEGTMYGPEGEGFIRINIATQRQRLLTALERIASVLSTLP